MLNLYPVVKTRFRLPSYVTEPEKREEIIYGTCSKTKSVVVLDL